MSPFRKLVNGYGPMLLKLAVWMFLLGAVYQQFVSLRADVATVRVEIKEGIALINGLTVEVAGLKTSYNLRVEQMKEDHADYDDRLDALERRP